ncbi:iron-sulfur cluster co-chaperone protein HscB isoform X1 [Hypanus sabinus]|uniref:iron-sulfur cluster co-chaperone protein HscB isoform X1 n=1 Tax=Hypanus sabinus TaxID=79690 RepID=UPI0028C41983|nr:iron-sulfur cluster co-chaperone protein HscB isoform X1 [Hypanus sabinus]
MPGRRELRWGMLLRVALRAALSPVPSGGRCRALSRCAPPAGRWPRGAEPRGRPVWAAARHSLRLYSAACWRCGAAPGPPGFFCPSCRALQPADRRLDYFQLLGLPRRYRLDTERLQESHRRLLRALHPDNFGQSTEAERRYSEEQSALVNEAYAALLRPLSRGLYLLQLELPGEPVAAEAEAEADPAFLSAVLELNERLAEAESQADIRRVATSVEERLLELDEQVVRAFEQSRPRDARPLLQRMKYWNSIRERVKERLLPR